MFQPFPAPPTEEDYFANSNNSKSIECIQPTSELLVNFRTNELKGQTSCFVYAEKMDYKGLVQLRITEKADQRKMFITTVDGAAFQELKQDQSLHVTFSGFIENLIHILQDCQSGKLQMCLVQVYPQHESRMNDSPGLNGAPMAHYQLQFVEMRPFKNLIHLSLPCRLAPLNVVLFYMNNILDVLQKKCLNQEQSMQQLHMDIHNRTRRIEQLEADCKKLRDSLLEATRASNQRHSEEVNQFQESLKKAAEQRQQDAERSRKTIASLQQQVDKLIMEKATLQSERTHEQKRNDSLSDDLAAAKTKINGLKETLEKQQLEISALKNMERKNEMHLQDSRKECADLRDKLKKYDKGKADLLAELEAEKKISQTKRQALEMATEEIAKANQIIFKQTQEISKMKKTIDWRTEVALQQEQAIKQKDACLAEKEQQIAALQKASSALRKEIPKELDSMRRLATALDTKYAEQINALKQKLEPFEKENVRPHKDSTRTVRHK